MSRFTLLVAFSTMVAGSMLGGCAPTAEDEAVMDEKMKLEGERADVLMADKADCAKLAKDLKAWKSANGDKLKAADEKFFALSKGKRDKLIESHRKQWDQQTNAMVQGGGNCIDEFKANF